MQIPPPWKGIRKIFCCCYAFVCLFCFQSSIVQEGNYERVWRILNKPICIICSTFCYTQVNEYHCQNKGLACFLKWPHKEAFVVWVVLIKTPISECYQMQKSEFVVQEKMSPFLTQTYITHFH